MFFCHKMISIENTINNYLEERDRHSCERRSDLSSRLWIGYEVFGGKVRPTEEVVIGGRETREEVKTSLGVVSTEAVDPLGSGGDTRGELEDEVFLNFFLTNNTDCVSSGCHCTRITTRVSDFSSLGYRTQSFVFTLFFCQTHDHRVTTVSSGQIQYFRSSGHSNRPSGSGNFSRMAATTQQGSFSLFPTPSLPAVSATKRR